MQQREFVRLGSRSRTGVGKKQNTVVRSIVSGAIKDRLASRDIQRKTPNARQPTPNSCPLITQNPPSIRQALTSHRLWFDKNHLFIKKYLD